MLVELHAVDDKKGKSMAEWLLSVAEREIHDTII